MRNMFKNRQSKDVILNTNGSKSEFDLLDDNKPTMIDTQIDNASSKEMKSTQTDKTSSPKTHSDPPTTASEGKTYVLANILDLARSAAELDFTTPELRELILDMKAWLARVTIEVERKHLSGVKNGNGIDTEGLLNERERGHLLILAEIGSIIYRLEERLRRRERFGGELRFRGKMVRRRVEDWFGRLKGRLGC